MSFNGPGITQAITPNTRNGVDTSYTFILQDASIANISRTGFFRGDPIPDGNRPDPRRRAASGILPDGTFEEDFRAGITTPVFLNESERKRSITITGKSVNVIARSITSETSTNVTVVGNDTGATFNLPITVKADPSKL